MKTEPLFIRFANGLVPTEEIIDTVLSSIRDEESKAIASKARENIPSTGLFKEDFSKALADMAENGITQQLINYVNSYMKPSLEEFMKTNDSSRSSEERWIKIKAADTPWIVAIICYNLCLYLKLYGIKEIKHCPVCKRFFSHKGKYAKYCSDACKASGGPK